MLALSTHYKMFGFFPETRFLRRKRLASCVLVFFCMTKSYAQSFYDYDLVSLQTLKPTSVSHFGSKTMLLSFFEPDCSWCYRQMKVFNHIEETCPHKLQPLVVGINGNRRQLRKELRRAKAKFPGLMASSQLMADVGDIPATPWTLVLDSAGDVVSRLRGYYSLSEMEQLLGFRCQG